MGDVEGSVRAFNPTEEMFIPAINRKEEEGTRVDGRRYLDGSKIYASEHHVGA